MKLIEITEDIINSVDKLNFGPPITHVYNPLIYAQEPHFEYVRRFGQGEREIVMLGMNPGPYGMAQTGVPFGDVTMVRDWMRINGKVGKPKVENPKRPVEGFNCPRSEVSGTRLWGWARDTFGEPENFFERFYVINYCPLCFMEESGRNFTPDKLPSAERLPLIEICNQAFRHMIEVLKPKHVIGIGGYAEKRAREALRRMDINIGKILHPSPASPAANRGWAEAAMRDLNKFGIKI